VNVLIQNYTSDIVTEPLYLHNCLKQVGVNAQLWGANLSVYDAMDSAKPDILILHYKSMSTDLLKYLKNNKHFKTDVVMNITGASQDDFTKIEQILKDNNIHVALYFNNIHESIQKIFSIKSKVISLLPGADVFLNAYDKDLTFHVEAAVISMNSPDLMKEIAAQYPTCHKLKFLGGATPDPDYDLPVTIMNLSGLYSRYDKVILADTPNVIFTQLFFDAALRSGVIVRTPEGQQTVAATILADLFNLSKVKDPATIPDVVLGQVVKKHTCYNRAQRLARQLKLTDVSDQLQTMVDKCEYKSNFPH